MSRYKRYERYKDSGVEWIGDIPEHWELRRIKFIGTLYSGNSFKEELQGKEEGDCPFYKVSDINGDGKLVTFSNNYVDKDDIVNNRWNIIPQNSILFAKIGEALKKNHRKINAYSCLIDNNIAALKPHEIVLDYNYFYYYFSCINAEWFVNPGTLPSINNTYLKNFIALLPSKNEQKIIANFLDQKTAEIDGLIADKEKLIELLQEKRQAIITEAVTKGLNPNVRMKDSGIEWIGDIPEHWEVKRIKYLTIVNPNKSEVRHLPSEQEVTFIPMEKIIATGKVDYSLTNTIENLVNGYTYFRDGDIIMAKVTPCFENGNIAIVEGLLNGIGFGTTELHVLRCNNKCFNKFLFYYLQSDVFKSKGVSEMYGVAGLKRIPTDFILNYKLGIPDYLEQEQIANYLDEKTSQIDELISNIQLQIQKLKEYRQSLISETVTGKIDVRDYYVNN
ncbi:restriction endonuclease subunit S [Tepidimicrobium xylanilyticum]